MVAADCEGRLSDACSIQPIGKRRDGGTKYWCLAHRADATAKYGKPAQKCRYADVAPIEAEQELRLCIADYPGGVGMWGAVPPVYDTTGLGLDLGIHVHARMSPDGAKLVDRTYRRVTVTPDLRGPVLVVEELDAIYYMVSSVFGMRLEEEVCPRCNVSHLDRDWFSVHPHQKHLCAGCGHTFRAARVAVGNPVKALQSALSYKPKPPKRSRKVLELRQSEFKGGVRIWGSNPAIVWTREVDEIEGVHVHAYPEVGAPPVIDETYGCLVVDGVELKVNAVRAFMAQSVLPHLKGRVVSLSCDACGTSHTDEGSSAVVPTVERPCAECGNVLKSRGRFRKVISNEAAHLLARLEDSSPRRRVRHLLPLIPETL